MPVTLDPTKLRKAVEASDKRLEKSRSLRVAAFQQYAGRMSGMGGDGKSRPINLVRRYATTLLPHIAGRVPEYDVTSRRIQFQADAFLLQTTLNHLAEEIHLAETCELVAKDAILGPLGVVRIGERVGDETLQVEDRLFNIGQPYCQRIDLDDYILDPSARLREQAVFEGHYFRVMRQALLESGLYDEQAQQVIRNIPSVKGAQVGQSNRLEHLMKSDDAPTGSDMFDVIELCELAIYDVTGTWLVQMPGRGGSNEVIRSRQYVGPERGPYEVLMFDPVPDTAHGVPPVAEAQDQAELTEKLADTWMTQAQTTRRIGWYTPQGEKDADSVKNAKNTQWVKVHGPKGQAWGVEDLGGVSDALQPAIAQMLAWSSLNTSMPSPGMSDPDSATEYQGEAAIWQQGVSAMQRTVDRFYERVGRQLAWYVTTAEVYVKPQAIRLPGGEQMQLVFDSQAMEADFLDLTFKIKPRSYSIQDQSIKSARMIQAMEMTLKGVELASITGGMVDPFAWARQASLAYDGDGLEDVIRDPGASAIKQQAFASLPGVAMSPMQPGYPQSPGLQYRVMPPGVGDGGPERAIDAGMSARSQRTPQAFGARGGRF